ncbi:MAG: hypothetical protein LBL00_07880 [Endomicrobium sp.]|jgi:hypothetical protein|nr:hypothetical protein [Endomicrobium sp.]
MTIKAARGIKEVGVGSVGVTDIVNGYAVLREQVIATNSYVNGRLTVFNKDRSKDISYSNTTPGGGYNRLYINQVNPEDITVRSPLSYISISFGQSYTNPGLQLANVLTASKDDDFLLLCGLNYNTNIFRIGIDPSTYQMTSVVTFDTTIENPKKLEIIDANNYVNYSGQNIQVFTFDGDAITLSKTIALDFDIMRVNAVNGYIVAIGLNEIRIINPIDETVIYEESPEETLADVVCDGNYVFVKTLSDTTNPVFIYEIADGAVNKIPFTVDGTFLAGAVKSLVNIVKDDNVSDQQYIMIYHSDNAANIMMSIDFSTSKVKSVEVGANIFTGTPGSLKPTFLSGNRIIYYSSTSGMPGTYYTYAYRYEYCQIEHRYIGRLYKIFGIG